MSVLLYHAPPSFYSQIARLVLAEKQVAYRAKLAAAGPPLFETYAPWYMRLNPSGTIPTLVDDGVAVPDSRAILSHVDAHHPGPALTPTDASERERMHELIAAAYRVEIRELSYSNERIAKIGARINGLRAKRLRKLAEQHADLREAYLAKLADIEGFTRNSQDPAALARQRAHLGEFLDMLERSLADRPFVAGSSYSLADVVATVSIARLLMLGDDPRPSRPAIAAWFERMRARPSYVAADIWEVQKPSRILKMVLSKLWPVLLGVTLLLGLLIWLLTRALR